MSDGSSPDPLGDEPPSSARPHTLRTARNTYPIEDPSTISISRHSITPRRTSPIKRSPRKRIFELDVGNDLSPRKLLVTVEAEEALKRGLNRALNRRLFQSSSPIRGDHRREAATTTTVPLNDELVDGETPRPRGRPRRISNGTPMPRGKKRAGTPLQKPARATRPRSDPESEAGLLGDESITADAGVTPKPRPKPRRTPKNASSKTQAVPSSQPSTNEPKRKRGRPRKTPVSEEISTPADTDNKSRSRAANTIQGNLRQLPSSAPVPTSDVIDDADAQQEMLDDYEETPMASTRPRGRAPISANTSDSHDPDLKRRELGSPHLEERTDDIEDDVSDNYPAMEPRSDSESNLEDIDDIPRSGQDTLAHASDFSMIAVESLPSFQASFQANTNGIPSDPPEMGEETNMIINQTLESWRKSTQSEDAHPSPARPRADIPMAGDNEASMSNGSLGEVSKGQQGRQKPLPLNRQIFAVKVPHMDDSFSSIPDSILEAATPGRLPTKPASVAPAHGSPGVYDDSFSKISEALLAAATPKPATRTADPAEEVDVPASQGQSSSVNRSVGSNFGSSRLPTPADTSSSNAGSKRGQSDSVDTLAEAEAEAGPSSNAGIRSSPPVINRPRAMNPVPSQLSQEANNTPGLQQSSPQLPPSSRAPSEPPKSLEPPLGHRPSLSPIVRVGRTLQNVMSDRSSPEGRESSLGSPFRGSTGNDHIGQSSTAGLLARPNPNITAQSSARFPFNLNSTLAQQAPPSFSQGGRLPHGMVIGSFEDPFGPDRPDYSETEALKKSAYGTNNDRSQRDHSAAAPSVTSSTRALPSEDDQSWVADSENRQQGPNQQPDLRPVGPQNSRDFASRFFNESQGAAMDTDTLEPRGMVEKRLEGDEDNGAVREYEAEEDDIWDFEASRPSPEKPEPAKATPQPDGLSARRSKIPSPWRRTSRRLIYQDKIASPSQIEIEESAQSEVEDVAAELPRRRSLNSQPRAKERKPETPKVTQSLPHPLKPRVELRDEPQAIPQEKPRDEPEDHPQGELDDQPQHEPDDPYDHPQDDPYYESHDELEGELHVDSGTKARAEPQQQITSPEIEARGRATVPVDASEYSILAQRTDDAPTTQQKPPPTKSRLFGGFDIMSFFSSPAALPQKNPRPEPADTTRRAERAPQPALGRLPPPREPQRSLWSTGLFSSIPQKEFQPSLDRRVDLPSPAGALPSDNTVPDTYEAPSPSPPPSPSPAPSHSPEPESPVSPQSSTPESQMYPPIAQKRNFTPRPGQSGSSLFQTGPPSANRSEADDSSLQVPSDDMESSRMTDDTDYERLPPREKPSRWDRTLSPSKSCFRSPMKPTTPGRVVAFTGASLPPPVQAQMQAARQQNGSAGGEVNTFFQGPILQPGVPRAREKVSTAFPATASSASFRDAPTAYDNDHHNVLTATSDATVDPPQTTEPNVHIDDRNHDPAVETSHPSVTTTTTSATSIAAPATVNLNPGSAAEEEPLPPPPQWTRAHWARLDALLQLRQADPLRFQRQCGLPSRAARWAVDTALLGKEVAARGARMVLAPWHLEVVHAFRVAEEKRGDGDGCPWEARDLAKRVFALIIGEERRRAAGGVNGVDGARRDGWGKRDNGVARERTRARRQERARAGERESEAQGEAV
ncbi:hypothetical protein GGS23DRAFT_567384 [Durotheca rogersii]|uniref:uncharacterized protein n=1 Tax=Durotheca rogersii TaxID=419775 RepID=UPI00221F064E|nr:uncharacterized protein GGS23DRAFT_567384 [Durotheca rogersii]KAI5863510.1 hypothetical protein GGS23DRAFT_567384 [Durotheca rogersii]